MKGSKPIAAELQALADLPDSKIDASDIPEIVDWSGAVRGRFHAERPDSATSTRLPRLSDEQKAEIRRLLRQAVPRDAIAARLGVAPGQVSAIKAHLMMETYDTEGGESDALFEAADGVVSLTLPRAISRERWSLSS